MSGYIKIPRDLFESHDFGLEKYSRREAFIDLVQLAAYKPINVTMSGIEYHLERGQLLTSCNYLAGRWQWSKGKVIRFMDSLCRSGKCSRQSDRITIITITNYELFQGDDSVTTAAAPRERQKRFVPPTVADVRAYCEENGFTIDPERFVEHYNSIGWVIGKLKTPMRDWKAAVRTWVKNQKNGFNNSPGGRAAVAPQQSRQNPSKYVNNFEISSGGFDF